MGRVTLVLALFLPGLAIAAAQSRVPPAGTYTLTVTGTYTSGSTTVTHNVTLTLTVN